MPYSSSSLTEPTPAWSAYGAKDDVAWTPTVTGCVRNYVYVKLRRNFSRLAAALSHRRRNRSRSRKVSDVQDRSASTGSSVESHRSDRSPRPTLPRDDTNTPTASYYEDGYGDFTDLLPDTISGNVTELQTSDAMLGCSSLESLWELDGSWASDGTDEERMTDGCDEARLADGRRSDEGDLVKRFVDLHDLTSVAVPRHCVRTGRLLLTGKWRSCGWARRLKEY